MALAFATVLVEFSAIYILLNGTLRALEAIWKKKTQQNSYIYNSSNHVIDFLNAFTWLRTLLSNLYIYNSLNYVTDRNPLSYGYKPN